MIKFEVHYWSGAVAIYDAEELQELITDGLLEDGDVIKVIQQKSKSRNGGETFPRPYRMATCTPMMASRIKLYAKGQEVKKYENLQRDKFRKF